MWGVIKSPSFPELASGGESEGAGESARGEKWRIAKEGDPTVEDSTEVWSESNSMEARRRSDFMEERRQIRFDGGVKFHGGEEGNWVRRRYDSTNELDSTEVMRQIGSVGGPIQRRGRETVMSMEAGKKNGDAPATSAKI